MPAKNEPRITVIIPVYNGVQFIAEAIQSVLSQTYQNFEIIVADDGSTDELRHALRRFNGKVTVLTLPHRGIGATRNAAIAASKGELIALLDSDDIWEPQKLELQVEYLDGHPDRALAYTYSTNFTGENEGGVTLVKVVDFEGYIFKDIVAKLSVANSTILMRKSAFESVGGYDESLVAMEDYDLMLRISRRYQVGRVPQSLLRRRIHPGSFYTSGYDNQYVFQLPVYDKLLNDPEVEAELATTKAAFLCNFITKFIYKNLYDGCLQFIPQKLTDLGRYAPSRLAVVQRLVAEHDVSSESWRPFITEFDTWHDDVMHKAKLFAKQHQAHARTGRKSGIVEVAK